MNKEFIPYEQALALKKLVKLKPMNKEFCTYSQSIALKELGFDEPCLAVYNNPEFMWARQLKGWEDHELDNVTNSIYAEGGFVTAPTYSQAFRWFREKYGYWSYIKEAKKETCRFYIEKFDEKFYNSEIYNSYEEAELACLKKLIEICRELK